MTSEVPDFSKKWESLEEWEVSFKPADPEDQRRFIVNILAPTMEEAIRWAKDIYMNGMGKEVGGHPWECRSEHRRVHYPR